VVLWGLLLLPLGFGLQAVGLFQTHLLVGWQSILFLVGVLLVSVPDGIEIINLSGSIFMAVALVPYGIQLISTAI
jgi:hypothetical protein